MAQYWNTQFITIPAASIFRLQLPQKANTFMIRNHDTAPIYMDLNSDFATTNSDAIAQASSWGVLTNPVGFQEVYLFSTGGVSSLKVVIAWLDAPATLLQNMVQTITATNVNVTGTVGLKAEDLALAAVTKYLSVDVKATTGLEPGDLNLDGSKNMGVIVNGTTGIEPGDLNLDGSKNLGVTVENVPEVDPDGYTWAKVVAAAPGTETVKAAAGKVACLVHEAAVNVFLVDGTDQAWKTGDITGIPVPIQCVTSIKLTFDGAGTAWILYK